LLRADAYAYACAYADTCACAYADAYTDTTFTNRWVI
jgi:hypothetical protein